MEVRGVGRTTGCVAALCIACAVAPLSAQDAGATTVIRAANVLDGRGGRLAGAAVVVSGNRIAAVLQGASADSAARRAGSVLDFGASTVLPGLIDVHVHISSYINAEGRSHAPLLDKPDDSETLEEMVLATAKNMRVTLESGITTAQSMGKPEDIEYVRAVENGSLPGPRLITTLAPIAGPAWPLTPEQLTPQGLRGVVRRRVADGAQAIKLFASKSIREGGVTIMTPAQLAAMCDEAEKQGRRSLVHAHSAESIRLAVLAGCDEIEHGVFATPEVLRLMAERGTYFAPQCGLVFRNYFAMRKAYLGIGNFTEEGFAAMERALPLATNVIRQASATPGLKLVWGTDAAAGSHGKNVDDLVCRVVEGGQSPMDALISATSRAAESLGLGREIGTLAPGYRADIIVVRGNPLEDFTAMHRVTFVMRDGQVHKLEPPARVSSQSAGPDR
jgi:imidazolonepropionase-like amidohydrolase